MSLPKRFCKFVKEDFATPRPKWTSSAWARIIGINDGGAGPREVPLTSKLVKKIWGTPINATVFHVTDASGAVHVFRNQGKKTMALSVMADPPSDKLAENGIWRGGVVMKLKANIIMGGQGDIMSTPDDSGRRWVSYHEIRPILLYDDHAPFFKEMEKAMLVSTHHLASICIAEVKRMQKTPEYKGFAEYVLKARLVILERLLRSTKVDLEQRQEWKTIFNDSPIILPPKELGVFVKDHIDRVNIIMEKYFLNARQEIVNIATGQSSSRDSYSELVANEYKVLGVAYYATDPWGVELEKLKNAVAGVPFWNFGTYDKQTSRWTPPSQQFNPWDYTKTKDYTEYVKK